MTTPPTCPCWFGVSMLRNVASTPLSCSTILGGYRCSLVDAAGAASAASDSSAVGARSTVVGILERMTLPANGMNKDDVRSKFGTPDQTHVPVGDPPITRWDYSGWSVYFEYDLVLFTVLHKGQVIDKN